MSPRCHRATARPSFDKPDWIGLQHGNRVRVNFCSTPPAQKGKKVLGREESPSHIGCFAGTAPAVTAA